MSGIINSPLGMIGLVLLLFGGAIMTGVVSGSQELVLVTRGQGIGVSDSEFYIDNNNIYRVNFIISNPSNYYLPYVIHQTITDPNDEVVLRHYQVADGYLKPKESKVLDVSTFVYNVNHGSDSVVWKWAIAISPADGCPVAHDYMNTGCEYDFYLGVTDSFTIIAEPTLPETDKKSMVFDVFPSDVRHQIVNKPDFVLLEITSFQDGWTSEVKSGGDRLIASISSDDVNTLSVINPVVPVGGCDMEKDDSCDFWLFKQWTPLFRDELKPFPDITWDGNLFSLQKDFGEYSKSRGVQGYRAEYQYFRGNYLTMQLDVPKDLVHSGKERGVYFDVKAGSVDNCPRLVSKVSSVLNPEFQWFVDQDWYPPHDCRHFLRSDSATQGNWFYPDETKLRFDISSYYVPPDHLWTPNVWINGNEIEPRPEFSQNNMGVTFRTGWTFEHTVGGNAGSVNVFVSFSQESKPDCKDGEKLEFTKLGDLVCVSICAGNNIFVNGECRQDCSLISGRIWSVEHNMCILNCASDQYYDRASDRCISKEPTPPQCSNGVWSELFQTCIDQCSNNEVWDVESIQCVPKCASGAYLDRTDFKCRKIPQECINGIWNVRLEMCIPNPLPPEPVDYRFELLIFDTSDKYDIQLISDGDIRIITSGKYVFDKDTHVELVAVDQNGRTVSVGDVTWYLNGNHQGVSDTLVLKMDEDHSVEIRTAGTPPCGLLIDEDCPITTSSFMFGLLISGSGAIFSLIGSRGKWKDIV